MGAEGTSGAPKRADARRNEKALLDAAATVFVIRGVDAPVRAIAAESGVGVGTIYRHFPTRADLVIGVYRHQIDALVDAAPRFLAESPSPADALAQWMDRFVDFLVTKHGLAGALRSEEASFDSLHAYFLERLVPSCASLLAAAVQAREVRGDIDALTLMHAAGNLCIGVESGGDAAYDAHRMVGLLIGGMRGPGA